MLKVHPARSTSGRDFNQIRPLNLKLAASLSFAGSCIASLGNTRVKCLVHLPKPSNKKIFGDSGYMNLEIKSNSTTHSAKSLEVLKTSILEAFERHIIFKDYPRQVIDAFIIIQSDDGGLLSASLMGLCLALIDCGIHVSDVISACSVYTFTDADGKLKTALDLTSGEERYYESIDPGMTVLHLSYCSNLNTIAYLQCTGAYAHGNILQRVLTTAHAACNVIGVEILKVLKDHNTQRSEQSHITLQTEYILPSADSQ